jgi:hypothetical protein
MGADLREVPARRDVDGRDTAVYGVVVPSLPARHGFVVAAGLSTALSILALRCFAGDVWALPEGTLAFADEPLIELSGPPAETLALARAVAHVMALQTAWATAAARVRLAAGGRPVIDASCRTHGADAARQRARAAVIGGATHTTNLWAASRYHVIATEAGAPEEAFPNVRGALVTADDLDPVEIRDLIRCHAPVTACAFGAHVPEVSLRIERFEREPATTPVGPAAHHPCPVQVYRLPAANGDAVAPRAASPVLFARPLLIPVMSHGQRLAARPMVPAARVRCAEALHVLPAEVADLERPEAVGVTWTDDVRRTPVEVARDLSTVGAA